MKRRGRFLLVVVSCCLPLRAFTQEGESTRVFVSANWLQWSLNCKSAVSDLQAKRAANVPFNEAIRDVGGRGNWMAAAESGYAKWKDDWRNDHYDVWLSCQNLKKEVTGIWTWTACKPGPLTGWDNCLGELRKDVEFYAATEDLEACLLRGLKKKEWEAAEKAKKEAEEKAKKVEAEKKAAEEKAEKEEQAAEEKKKADEAAVAAKKQKEQQDAQQKAFAAAKKKRDDDARAAQAIADAKKKRLADQKAARDQVVKDQLDQMKARADEAKRANDRAYQQYVDVQKGKHREALNQFGDVDAKLGGVDYSGVEEAKHAKQELKRHSSEKLDDIDDDPPSH